MSDAPIEITQFPEALWDTSVAVTRLTLQGRRLGDSAGLIDPSLITNAWSLDVFPPGFVSCAERRREDDTYEWVLLRKKWDLGSMPYGSNWLSRWKRRRWHKHLKDRMSEPGTPWPLEERIAFVSSNSGVIRLQREHAYSIEEGSIAHLILNPASLGELAGFSKRDLIERFGLPDYIWEYYGEDPELFSTHLLYSRGIYVKYFDYDHAFTHVGIRQDITPWLNSYYVPYTGQPTDLFS